MSRADFSDYVPSMDFDEDMFRAMVSVAERVNGNLAVTREGMVIIYGTALINRAVTLAGTLRPKDFPYGMVVPGTDSTLVFEF